MNDNNIELLASLKFLNNPEKVAKHLNANTNIENIEDIVGFFQKLSDEETKKFIPELVNTLVNYKSEYKSIYDDLKNQVKNDEEKIKRSISPSDISSYLQIIKDNWEAIAIIACFLRSLGNNEISFKSSSVFEGLSNILSKSQTKDEK